MSTSEFHSVVSEFFDDQGWSTTATLIKTISNDSTYNEETSENVPIEKRYTIKVIPFDYINKNEGSMTNAGTLIRSGDKQVLIQPSKYVKDIDPSADKLQLGTKIYRIITVKELNPRGDDALYYELFVRI